MLFYRKKGPAAHADAHVSPAEAFGFFGCVVSDVGCVRPNNEDNFFLDLQMNTDCSDRSEAAVAFPAGSGLWRSAGVFDGIGGGERGDLAARDAAAIFIKALVQPRRPLREEEADSRVRQAFLEANNRSVELQRGCRVCGTTGTVLCSSGQSFKIYHLGDSRAYLFREGLLRRLTKDQTLAQMKLDSGLYPRDGAPPEADRHVLTEYIGRDWTGEELRPQESPWLPIRRGDMVLLCSDGLYDMCDERQMKDILSGSASIREKAALLVDRARANGGVDNITCVLLLFEKQCVQGGSW